MQSAIVIVTEALHCVSVEDARRQLLHQPQEVCEAQPRHVTLALAASAASAAAVEEGEHVTHVVLAHFEP